MTIENIFLIIWSVFITIFIISGAIDIVRKITHKDIQAVGQAIDAVKECLPDNQVVNKIIEYAKIGVGYAEQAYLAHDLPPDERKEIARHYIRETLKQVGVDPYASGLDLVIDGAIEAAVLALGHKIKPD